MASQAELRDRLRGKVMDLPDVNDLFDNQEELGDEHYDAALQDALDEFNESVFISKKTLSNIQYVGVLLALAQIHLVERIIIMISRNELPYTHQEINVNMGAKVSALERIVSRLRAAALPRLREAKAAMRINHNMMSGIDCW